MPALAGSAVEARDRAGARRVPAPTTDTILWPDLRAPRPGGLPGPQTLFLGLKPLRLHAPLEPLPPLGLRHFRLLGPGESLEDLWLRDLRSRLEPGAFLRASLGSWPLPEERSATFLPPLDEPEGGLLRGPAPAADTLGQREISDFMSEWTDLGMRVQTLTELGGDWTRFRPCESQLQESCNPTLLPQLSPDLTFGVQVAGTISDRIHVDVDFDQTREFDATNRINIAYLGAPDDILRRLDIGDVTFRLPSSRFLTEGIPAGNFGFQAEGQFGPLDFQAVWAEQKGDLSQRVFRLTGTGNQRRFVQEDTLELDDTDYLRGQFFFLVDPAEIVDYPHLDVLSLDAGSAAATVLPGIEPVQLYRFENNPVLRHQVEGFIQADAVLERDGDQVVESGWFRYLQPGQDYFVHPSGLWIGLRNPLSREEMLAVTYITAAGDTVGDYNPEGVYSLGRRPELLLLKASGANHQPGRPTWEMELHNVYRVSSSPDVERASVGVTISLGELSSGRTFKRATTGEDVTYLRLLGLDEESPVDQVDPAALYSPGEDAFVSQPPVQGTFLVFPTLEPFKRPPPLPGLGLTAEEAAELLGEDANPRIYDDPDPFERDNGSRFRLTIPFRHRSEGVISSFGLGALGIREESERIFLEDRLLVRGVDYEIDYANLGQVTLTDPEGLFATQPEAAIRATWEQKQIFQEAPTSVFGLSTHSRLGDVGGVDVLGLYRSQKTLVNRPGLGLAPASIALGGVNGTLDSGVLWLDRFLGRVPGLRVAGESSFALDGELALSFPNPNTRGEVFVDDFDASNERPLSLLAQEWRRGSAPAFTDGAEAVLPLVPDEANVASLVWQHTWILEAAGDSVGIHEGFLPRQQIDQQIRVAGSQSREQGLLLTLGSAVGGGSPRWASVTTVLSQTGTDLTKSEFLEFYVEGGTALTLVMDLGTVGEDAMFVDSQGRTGGVKDTGVPWGLGLLDQEADPARGEIWGTAADARGVWDEDCEGERGRIYRRGDGRAVCTRGNGRNDSEDMDGDGNLDEREKYLRYVISLDGLSPFLARTREETGTAFQLYRIPLQGLDAIHVGGQVTEADMRAVRHLRVTVAGPRAGSLTLARMRVVGSRWIKRSQDGVLRGIIGDTASFMGRVEVTPVSRLSEGEAYQAPPGVLEQLSDPTSAFAGQGIEFNEKSLAVRFEDIQPGERAEVYNRFPQRPRSFLAYRQARLWLVSRSGDVSDGTYFYLKVGTDPENFYLYRTPVRPPPLAEGVTSEDWLPEVVVDFDEWLDLRRRAEETLIRLPPGPGDPPVTAWGPDSTYAVVLKDRGRAPNLDNVRELAMGVWNVGDVPASGEIWVDELRLAAPVRDAGVAGFVGATLAAGDVIESRFTFSSRGALFRQLEEDPTYQADRTLSVSSTVRLGRFTPAAWGVELPLSVSHDRLAQDPTFLAGSDILAKRLSGLRDTGSRQTRVSLGFRKVAPSANPVVSALLDGLDANLGWFSSHLSAVTTQRDSEGIDAHVGYSRSLDRRDIGLVPRILRPLVRWLLPESLEDRVANARLRWTPERFSVGTSYVRQENRILRFEQIIELPRDSAITPTLAPRQGMESVAEVRFRPLDSFSADMTLLTVRDLLAPVDAVGDPRVQTLLGDERADVMGVDLGWETNRVLRTSLGLGPRFVPWLRHSVDWTTHYRSDRNATFVQSVETGADTTLSLTRNASGERSIRGSVVLDVEGMIRSLQAPADSGEVRPRGPLTRIGEALDPISFTFQDALTSRFNRDPVSPGIGYQLGLGGVEDFRVMEGDTAAAATDRFGWTLGSAVRLSRGVRVDLGYRTLDEDVLDSRSERTVLTETWPDVVATFDGPQGIEKLRIDRVRVRAGYRKNVREEQFGGAAQQRRLREDWEVPLQVTVGWAGSSSVAYNGSLETGEGADPTGDTEREGNLHSFSLTSSFVPPLGIADALDRPVTLGLIASYRAERECRVARFRADCVAFIDQINRGVNLTLETSTRGFEVGLRASWTDRQSFVGLQTGSTQFQLGVFGQFLFEAGNLPAGPRQGSLRGS